MLAAAANASRSSFSDSNTAFHQHTRHFTSPQWEARLTEMQFFQCLSISFREEEVDKHNLKAKPNDVHNQILPIDIFEADRVDEGTYAVS